MGRRLYRTGESDYLVNRAPARLLDVNDIFFGSGVGRTAYSIIEQGRIGQIVSARARGPPLGDRGGGRHHQVQEASRGRRAEDGGHPRTTWRGSPTSSWSSASSSTPSTARPARPSATGRSRRRFASWSSTWERPAGWSSLPGVARPRTGTRWHGPRRQRSRRDSPRSTWLSRLTARCSPSASSRCSSSRSGSTSWRAGDGCRRSPPRRPSGSSTRSRNAPAARPPRSRFSRSRPMPSPPSGTPCSGSATSWRACPAPTRPVSPASRPRCAPSPVRRARSSPRRKPPAPAPPTRTAAPPPAGARSPRWSGSAPICSLASRGSAPRSTTCPPGPPRSTAPARPTSRSWGRPGS